MSERFGTTLAKAFAASVLVLVLNACGGNSSSTTTTTPAGVSAFSGSYVFSVTGTDPTDGDYGVLGSLVADGNGKITSGVADYNLGSGIDTGVALTGTYTVSGSTVMISLTDGHSTQDTITATLPNGLTYTPISSFDGTGAGVLYSQVTTGFTPVGIYNFTISGEGNFTASGSGQFVITSGNTISSGALTYFDGATSTNYAASGFVYAPTASGRGQAALIGNNLSYYIIGPHQLMLISLDRRSLLLIPAQKS